MEVAVFIIIILVASTLQTSTGFGFSILATPFLLLIFEPAEAIQINLVLSLVISTALIRRIRKDIDYGVLKRFIIGSSVGMFVGIIIFLMVDIDGLKRVIGIVILALTLLLIFKFRIDRNRGRDFFAGGIAGSLTTSIGMPGPPLLLYFSGTDSLKEKVRGTTLAFYLFIYTVSLIIQIVFAGTGQTVWIASLWGLPLVFMGLFVGQMLFRYINQKGFRIFTYVILVVTGIYLLMDSAGLL
ncbi:sulfite exporter TauE/SafE family protein [Salinicoccus bachuensis]|uniref:Probable membrane transporter protein n=1 Tax=Salinicoccus bachuensis TaxID=3136731 RepID=A0ABZ3CGH0_9STAP